MCHGWDQLMVFDDFVKVGDEEELRYAFWQVVVASRLVIVYERRQVEISGRAEERWDLGVGEVIRLTIEAQEFFIGA